MPPAVDAAPALRLAASVGPFFSVAMTTESVAWQAFSTLLDPYSGALRVGVGSTREALAARTGTDVEDRVAASLWLLGWSARLVSPWLGAAVLGGVVPIVGPDDLRWQAGPGQPVPLALRLPRGRSVDPVDRAGTARTLYAECIVALVEPLLEATARAYPISRKVLWGNVASAVAGATAQLARAGAPYAGSARAIGRRLLATDRLEGQGGFTGGQFARRTCCLMYRLPDSGLCTDCVLVRRPAELPPDHEGGS